MKLILILSILFSLNYQNNLNNIYLEIDDKSFMLDMLHINPLTKLPQQGLEYFELENDEDGGCFHYIIHKGNKLVFWCMEDAHLIESCKEQFSNSSTIIERIQIKNSGWSIGFEHLSINYSVAIGDKIDGIDFLKKLTSKDEHFTFKLRDSPYVFEVKLENGFVNEINIELTY